MVKCENGQIEWDGDAITLTADVCTSVLAVRDLICEQADIPEVKECLRDAYEKSILRVLAIPIGQSDEERQKARKNP